MVYEAKGCSSNHRLIFFHVQYEQTTPRLADGTFSLVTSGVPSGYMEIVINYISGVNETGVTHLTDLVIESCLGTWIYTWTKSRRGKLYVKDRKCLSHNYMSKIICKILRSLIQKARVIFIGHMFA